MVLCFGMPNMVMTGNKIRKIDGGIRKAVRLFIAKIQIGLTVGMKR